MSDLLMPDEADDELRELLAGYDMVGYHATRLMKHELSVIRQEGLRPFSRDLFNDRIARAFLAGEIDAPTRDALMGATCTRSASNTNGGSVRDRSASP